MLWHIFDLFILLSQILLAIGRIAYHESLCGDQASNCMFEIGTFLIMLCSHLFSVAGPLNRGGHSFRLNKQFKDVEEVLLFSIRILNLQSEGKMYVWFYL